MRKNESKHRWEEENIRQFLLNGGEEEKIPESLQPEQMEKLLRKQCHTEERITENGAEGEKRVWQRVGKHVKWQWCTLAAAACLAVVLFAAGRNLDWGIKSNGDVNLGVEDDTEIRDGAAADETEDSVNKEETSSSGEGTTYDKLYQSFHRYWEEQEKLFRTYGVVENATVDDAALADDAAAESEAAMDTGSSAATENMMDDDAASGMQFVQDDTKEQDKASETEDGQGEESGEDYGKTNQQEEKVEEADIIKNDGRYLYRVIYRWDNHYKYIVRIVDTKDGLKEAARVGDFENIQEIYVWKDTLVVIEQGWAEEDDTEDDMADDRLSISGCAYFKAYVYDISDRTNPKEYHTFTVKGSYMDSRISDGYLYFFASCDTQRPENAGDLRRYVPMMDGKPMPEERITLPEGDRSSSYLVMASVDMGHPDKFTDTRALVTEADKFYVSQNSIYVADMRYISYENEGHRTDSTTIYRYSYKNGKMRREAEGKVKGTLRDDLAMNEYQGYLRLVTTVESEEVSKIVDDISGEILGYDSSNYQTTNSLYVLDSNLKTVGKIEGLAKDERIYSARFMGNTGYFVTFRETDPLFSVDLSNPRKPEILGELKISGFSEYLHFYADNLLLGIGMEADEESGITDGLKLSMFDISNPADVKEQSKLNLSEYDYSEALYNYKAVLIDTRKNLFGFAVEGYGEVEEQYAYVLYTFENGEFRKIMEIDCGDGERYGRNIRGTYIGDRFFLTAENGLVEEYSLIDGSKTGELEIK